ncbi:MAG: hypothetical protein ACYC1C_08430 [Chloroflexota bacterium]
MISAGRISVVSTKSLGAVISGTWADVLVVTLVSVLTYGIHNTAVLYSDDWAQVIGGPAAGTASWLNFHRSRPLLYAPFILQHNLLGTDVLSYRLVLLAFQTLVPIVLLLVLNNYPSMKRYRFSLVVALLCLVYPTDYSRMWLTHLHNTMATVLALLYAFWLLRFAQKGRGWYSFALAIASLIVSFGLYEGPLGLICAWAIILVVRYRGLPIQRRLALVSPVFLVAGLALWRILGQQALGFETYGLSQFTLDPHVLFSRLLLGYKITLGWGWTTTLDEMIPWLPGNAYALALIVIVILLLWYLLRRTDSLFQRYGTDPTSPALPFKDRWPAARPYSYLCAIGLALVGIGYVPVIAVYLPNLSDISSRFNQYAVFGGSLALAAALMIGVHLIARSRQQIFKLFWASSLVFLLLGMITQYLVQEDHEVAWNEQRVLWNRLLTRAPSFKDDTVILLILPGYQDRVGYQNWKRTPLHAEWDASSAVRILYGNPTLSARLLFPDIETTTESRLTPEGIVSAETGDFRPYASVAAFVYDDGSQTLERLEKLPGRYIDSTSTAVSLCTDCVAREAIDVPLRRLVQE